MKISSIFVAFLENMNFNKFQINEQMSWKRLWRVISNKGASTVEEIIVGCMYKIDMVGGGSDL